MKYLVLALILLFPAVVIADCYGRPRAAYTAYSHSYSSYRSSSYWPGGYWGGYYYAPGYYYDQTPHEAHVDHFYLIDNSYRDAILLKAIRGAFTEVLAKDGPQAPAARPAQREAFQPMPPADAPLKTKWQDVPSKFQNEKLLAVVNTRCVRCHGPSKQEKGLSLVTSDGKALAKVSRECRLDCSVQALTGDMPKNGSKVEDQSVALFVEWAKAKEE